MARWVGLTVCVFLFLPPRLLFAAADPQTQPAEALYLKLSSVGLNPVRVYSVREVTFDRAAFHITLEDGTIAFTEDVMGRVTGAFFEGDGEVLMSPPDQVERSSMALFTGAAILEEKFGTAYFRFNDDTFTELQAQLRPAQNQQEFVTQWNGAAKNLASADALRIFMTFSQLLPAVDSVPAPPDPRGDHMLHARLQGRKLGTFDLYYDTEVVEQIWAGQLSRGEDGSSYYNVWSSFSLGASRGPSGGASAVTEEGGRADAVRILGYRIRAEVRPPTELKAEASLQIEIREGGQRAMLFELSRYLQLSLVDADGHPLEFIHNPAVEGTQLSRRGNDLVVVVFPRTLRQGEKLQLHFVYSGTVLSEAGGGLLYVGARGTWYPHRGLAMSDFDLEFRYPPEWTLVATGKRIGTTAEQTTPSQIPPENFSHWVSDRPIPLAGFNLGKYSHATARAGDVPVIAYAASAMERAFPKGAPEVAAAPTPNPRQTAPVAIPAPDPSPARNAQSVAEQSAHGIEAYARWYGAYPYSSLALTQMPGTLSQGWPGLIFLSSFSFLSPAERARLNMPPVEKTFGEIVVWHETAHQWWGDSVVWSSYRDQWLIEALANYSALLLLQSTDPLQFRMALDKYRDDLLATNKREGPLLDAGPVTLGSRLTSSRFPDGYESVSYGRGTWLMHMLRTMMRDADKTGADDLSKEPFVRALHRLRERYQGRAMTTADFLRVMAEELPPSLQYEGQKSLDWFLSSWVNGTAVPRLELQGVKYVPKGSSVAVTGTIVQKFVPKNFVTSVPVYSSVGGRTAFLGRVFADGPESQFHITAPAGTRKVVLDPERSILSRVR